MARTILSQVWIAQGGKLHNFTGKLVFKYPHSNKFFLYFKIIPFISIFTRHFLSYHCIHSGWLHTYSSRHVTAWLQHLYPPIRYGCALINSSPKSALIECKKPQLHCLSCKPFIILVVLQWTCRSMFMSLFYPRAYHWTDHPDVSHQCWGQREGHLSWPLVMFCLMQPGWLLVFFATRTVLAHGQLGVHQDSQAIFCHAALWLIPHLCWLGPIMYMRLLVPGCQVWHFHLLSCQETLSVHFSILIRSLGRQNHYLMYQPIPSTFLTN